MSLNKYVFSSLLFWLFSNPFLLPVVSNLCFFPPPLTLRYALSRGTATSNGWVFEACPTASSTNVILSCCDVVFEMSHWGSAVWSIDWSALVHWVPLRNGDANIHKVTEGEGFKNRVRGDWRQPGGQDNMEGGSEKTEEKMSWMEISFGASLNVNQICQEVVKVSTTTIKRDEGWVCGGSCCVFAAS